MLVHTGTKNLTNSVNTMYKVRKIIKTVEEIDDSNEIKFMVFQEYCEERSRYCERNQGNKHKTERLP